MAMNERRRPLVMRGELLMPVLNRNNKASNYGLLFNGNPFRKSKLTPQYDIKRDATYLDLAKGKYSKTRK